MQETFVGQVNVLSRLFFFFFEMMVCMGIYPNIHSHALSELEFVYVMSAKNRQTRLL